MKILRKCSNNYSLNNLKKISLDLTQEQTLLHNGTGYIN